MKKTSRRIASLLIVVLLLNPAAGLAAQAETLTGAATSDRVFGTFRSVKDMFRVIMELFFPSQKVILDYEVPLSGPDALDQAPAEAEGALDMEAEAGADALNPEPVAAEGMLDVEPKAAVEPAPVPAEPKEEALPDEEDAAPPADALAQVTSEPQTPVQTEPSSQQTSQAAEEETPVAPIEAPTEEEYDADEGAQREESAVKECTVTLLDASGVTLLTAVVAEGESFPLPNISLAADGYRLAHWYDVTRGEDVAYDFATLLFEDITLRAHVVSIEEEEAPPEETISEEVNPEETMESDEAAEATGSVSVYSDAEQVLLVGQMVMLTAVVDGYEGVEYTLQWQQDSGAGWKDLPGENGETYSFPASAETMRSSWRAIVNVPQT